MKRRTFIKAASLAGAATMITKNALSAGRFGVTGAGSSPAQGPVIVSTWDSVARCRKPRSKLFRVAGRSLMLWSGP